MATSTFKEIPQAIKETLKSGYTNPYNLLSNWEFNLSELKPELSSLLTDLSKLFVPSQRWTPEAIGRFGESANFWIGLHTQEPTPTRSVGLFNRKTFLRLDRTVDNSIGCSTEQRFGSKHSIYIYPVPKLGPFGSENDLETAATPYYIANIGVTPFYYYFHDNGRNLISGEDTSRMIFEITLRDGREKVQNTISQKLNDHQKQLARAREELILLGQKKKEATDNLSNLTTTSRSQLIGKDQSFLKALNSRPDPFGS